MIAFLAYLRDIPQIMWTDVKAGLFDGPHMNIQFAFIKPVIDIRRVYELNMPGNGDRFMRLRGQSQLPGLD